MYVVEFLAKLEHCYCHCSSSNIFKDTSPFECPQNGMEKNETNNGRETFCAARRTEMKCPSIWWGGNGSEKWPESLELTVRQWAISESPSSVREGRYHIFGASVARREAFIYINKILSEPIALHRMFHQLCSAFIVSLISLISSEFHMWVALLCINEITVMQLSSFCILLSVCEFYSLQLQSDYFPYCPLASANYKNTIEWREAVIKKELSDYIVFQYTVWFHCHFCSNFFPYSP